MAQIKQQTYRLQILGGTPNTRQQFAQLFCGKAHDIKLTTFGEPYTLYFNEQLTLETFVAEEIIVTGVNQWIREIATKNPKLSKIQFVFLKVMFYGET